MELEVKQKDKILTVKPLDKSIEAANSRDFKSKLIDLINQGQHSIILNLSQIEFMDSSGLGSLISILKLLASHQGNIILCETQEPVKRIFTLTRLNQVFSLYPSEEEAFKFLQANSTPQKT